MSQRKQFLPEQKVAMIRRHLIENVPVSDLCDEFKIHATQYYNWQKQFFENGESVFARRPNTANLKRQQNSQDKKIERLEKKLQDRNEVVRRVVAGTRAVKKSQWGTLKGCCPKIRHGPTTCVIASSITYNTGKIGPRSQPIAFSVGCP